MVDPEGSHRVRFVVTRVPVSPEKPHGIDYSLTLHGPDGERLVGFDMRIQWHGRSAAIRRTIATAAALAVLGLTGACSGAGDHSDADDAGGSSATNVESVESGEMPAEASGVDAGDVAVAADAPAPDAPAPEPRDADERLPLIGRSVAMQEIYRTIARLTTTDLTVMVNGESGTGKELVARALHDYGRRRAGPFVAINMAAIPRELIESELFGHERGAFTGATNRNQGRFEQAAGGTLFLDEIGDMPPEAQTRLLRVLQEGEFTTVGGRQPIRANVRIVTATHRDLRQAIRAGQFREDLFYRLAVVPIRLPPLRERTEDIPVLARHFLDKAREAGLPGKTLNQGAVDRLRQHRWPGNVRELENLMRRLAALYPQETIAEETISAELADAGAALIDDDRASLPEPLAQAVERHIRQFLAASRDGMPMRDIYDQVIAEVERPLIQMTLSATRGNQIKAAAMLGLNRNTLRKKIRDLDIAVVRGVG